jgi:hypothetical protein
MMFSGGTMCLGCVIMMLGSLVINQFISMSTFVDCAGVE